MSQPASNFARKRAQWCDQIFDDRELTPVDFKVVYALSRFLNRETFTAFPGQMVLAEKAHVSIRAVRDSLNRLASTGHLKIATNRGGVSICTPVLLSTVEETPDARPKAKGKVNGHDAKAARTPAADWPSNYRDIVWQNYPRKEGCGPAMAALDALARSVDCPDWNTFDAGLNRYCDYAKKLAPADRRFIPYLAKWVNEKRWRDTSPPVPLRHKYDGAVRP